MFQERTIQESCCKHAMKNCLVFNEHRTKICCKNGVYIMSSRKVSKRRSIHVCNKKNFEAFDCWPLPWLLSSQMRRSWPATEILPQTANPSCWSSKVDSQVTATNPVDRCPAIHVPGAPCTLALACTTYRPQRWWGSRAPKVHQKCQELRSSWFPQKRNSSQWYAAWALHQSAIFRQ